MSIRFDTRKLGARRLWFRIAMVAVLLLVVVPTLLLWYAVSSKPSYWQPLDPQRTDVRETARQFEQAMSAQVPKPAAAVPATDQPAPSGERSEWTLVVTLDQLNSWLAVGVTEWGVKRGLDPRVLDRLSRSVVNVDLDAVEVAVPVERAGLATILRLRYKPVVGEGKRVRLMLQGAQAGLVPVPITTVLDNIAAYLPQGQRAEIEALRGKVQSLDLRLLLEDGRTVSVTDLALLPGKLLLTCRVDRG
jgi:hypothetical protein